MPAEKRLKNYDLDDFALDDNEPFDSYETTFVEPSGYSQKLEQLFSYAIEDIFPDKMKNDARSALKGIVDDAYRMADDIGLDGIQKIESVLNEFKFWCNQQHAEKEKGNDGQNNFSNVKGKRKFVPMTSKKYTSTVK